MSQLKPFPCYPQHFTGIVEVAFADFVVHLGQKQVVVGIYRIYSDRFHSFEIVPLSLFVFLGFDLLVPFELVVTEQGLSV